MLSAPPICASVGDICIVAFQLEVNKVIICPSKEVKEFLKNFKTDNFILQQEIDEFLYLE